MIDSSLQMNSHTTTRLPYQIVKQIQSQEQPLHRSNMELVLA